MSPYKPSVFDPSVYVTTAVNVESSAVRTARELVDAARVEYMNAMYGDPRRPLSSDYHPDIDDLFDRYMLACETYIGAFISARLKKFEGEPIQLNTVEAVRDAVTSALCDLRLDPDGGVYRLVKDVRPEEFLVCVRRDETGRPALFVQRLDPQTLLGRVVKE